MDVLPYLTLCTLAALEQQREKLLEPDLFELGADGDVQQEGKEVFGPESADLIEEMEDEEGKKEDNSEAVNQDMEVHTSYVLAWENRKPKLQHEYAMAGFAFSRAGCMGICCVTGHAWPGSA